jgi:hypothetical protein
MVLTACNSTKITSPFYIKGKNNGIGNSMFQIASGLNFARKHNAQLYIPSLNKYFKEENLKKEHTIFRNINTQQPTTYNENKLLNTNNNRDFIFDYEFYDGMTFHNYYENYLNIEDMHETLMKIFGPNDTDIKYLIDKYPIINTEPQNLTTIHVRRGPDICAIKNKQKLNIMETCTIELLDYMIAKKNITNVFVKTNDHDYCKKIFDSNHKYNHLKFYYSQERDFYDIWLISLVKNNIVSASTLAWWGSYLNKHPDKFIIGHHLNIGTHNPNWLYI